MREQRFAVAVADRFGQQGNVLVEAAEHFEHRILVGEEHVAPHGRIGSGDAGKIAEAAGGEFQYFRARHAPQFVGRADDRVGNQMRQVAGDGEHKVVVVRRHGFDIGAEQPPEFGELVDGLLLCALRRRQDAPAVDEQLGEAGIGPRILGPGHRMRRHEMHIFRQMRTHVADDRALDRADIGDGGTGSQMWRDLLRHRAAGADRNAQDHQIGAFDRGGVGFHHLIGEAELGHAPACLCRARGGDDRADRALQLRRARDRRADQADADEGEAVVKGLLCHARSPRARPVCLPLAARTAALVFVANQSITLPSPRTR